MLTLTGPGGAGKTRLSIEVAHRSLESYPDGVWFIELGALTDPALVMVTVASTLGVREEPDRPLSKTLIEWLVSRKALLLLDNCEHLVEACSALVSALLRDCADLHVLATSRQALNVSGEVQWGVHSMSFPDPDHLPPLESLAQYEAVQLFVERARYKRQGFALTPENAASIARLCQGLDGMPLALELAAARISALTVQQILARLDERFRLFTSGGLGVSPRQRTLRAAIDWSYDLLPEDQRALLCGLSVFAGGFSLEAALGICTPEVDEYETIDTLGHLVDNSLVIAEEREGEARYRLLDTIRYYAWEKLEASGEALALRTRHLDWYLSLAETARTELQGPNQKYWLDRLDANHDNLRAALHWSLSPFGQQTMDDGRWTTDDGRWTMDDGRWTMDDGRRTTDDGRRTMDDGRQTMDDRRQTIEAGEKAEGSITYPKFKIPQSGEAALRMVGALWSFWVVYGYVSEGRRWSEQALAVGNDQLSGPRAGALYAAGALASFQGDYSQSQALLTEGLTLYRQMDNKTGVARVLDALGVLAARQSNYRDATLSFMESLALRRELGDKKGIDSSLNNLGHVATAQGDYAWARQLLDESLSISRELGDTLGMGTTLNNLGHVAVNLGDYTSANDLYQESLQIKRELEDKVGIASSLNSLGNVARHESRHEDAQALYEESLALSRELGHKEMIVMPLNNLGHVYSAVGDYERARSLYRESLTTLRDLGDKQAIATALAGLADVAGRQGQLEWAGRLFGAAHGLLEATGTHLEPHDQGEYEVSMASVRARLNEERWQAAWERGLKMTPSEAVDMALYLPNPIAHVEPGEAEKAPPAQIPFELTRRELEVLTLLSKGLSDVQIAEQLFLSRHTIHAHLRSVFNKLGVTSRLAAARLATEYGLA